MDVELIARVCHEANRAFCEATGDYSQKSWADCDDWQRESSIIGVRYALENNPTPAGQHEAWLQHKISTGWTFGASKDAVTKTHPSIVPYEKLPEIQKTKDHLFLAVVKALSREH